MGATSWVFDTNFYSKFRYFFVIVSYQVDLGSLTGPILCYFIGRPFIERFGWENLFIWGGILGIFSGIVYSCLVEAEPEDSKLVCAEELAFIQQHRLDFKAKRRTDIPYRQAIKSLPVWSPVIGISTFAMTHGLFGTVFPKFLTVEFWKRAGNFRLNFSEVSFGTRKRQFGCGAFKCWNLDCDSDRYRIFRITTCFASRWQVHNQRFVGNMCQQRFPNLLDKTVQLMLMIIRFWKPLK